MTESWIVYVLVFVLVVVAAQQAQSGIAFVLGERKQTRHRFAELADGGAPLAEIDSLRRRASRGSRLPLVSLIERLIVQSGIRRGTPFIAGIATAVGLLFVLLLPSSAGSLPVRVAAAAAGGILATWLGLRWMRARRMARFGEQLPEILDIITRSLRAGHPLPVSLALVAREMPDPAGPEFALLVDEINYGRSVSEALDNLYQRVGYPELRFVVASTSIASQTGGNLGEILGRLARTLRERFRLQRRARALSAEGRFSGYALSAMPIVLFAVINVVSPVYYAQFWDSSSAGPVFLTCLGLLLLGNAIIYRLVNFRV